MIGTKCPGQDTRYWTAEDAHEEKCPQCGEMIEFFKTDIRLRCPYCKTRVANSDFNMGCAQWCAYAEQCLGPGARGLKTKSLKVVMEEELDRLALKLPELREKVKHSVKKAEELCSAKHIDMLPLVTALIIISLINNNLVEDLESYLDSLQEEHSLPGQALKEAKALIDEVANSNIESEMAKLVYELL